MFANTVSAIVLFVALSQAVPANAAVAADPFRFNYTTAELQSQAGRDALDVRLRAEASTYCRRVETNASVVGRGCRQAVITATREAMARALAGGA